MSDGHVADLFVRQPNEMRRGRAQLETRFIPAHGTSSCTMAVACGLENGSS
jgi:hypothetical protein